MAAAFSTAPRARRFARLAVEETDIRNGKDSSKIRSRFQTATGRTNRSRPAELGAGSARLSASAQRAGALARSVSQQLLVDRSAPRERQLEAENEKLKAKIGELVMQMEHLKKLQAWVQQRRNADTSVITAKNLDQFRKPAK